MMIKPTSFTLLIASVLFFSGCSLDIFNQTPKCSNPEVVDTLAKLLNTDSRKATIDIDMIRQIELNEQNGMRTCQTNVDFVYNVNENTGLIDQVLDGFRKGMTGSSAGVSKNNSVVYTIILGDTGKKYIVNLKQ